VVSKKTDTDDSFFEVGTIVKVIDQENFFMTDTFMRNYIEFVVEGVTRFRIKKMRTSSPPISTCKVLIYDDEKCKSPSPLTLSLR